MTDHPGVFEPRVKGRYVLTAVAVTLGLFILLGLEVWHLPWLEVLVFGWFLLVFPLAFWGGVALADPPPRRRFDAGSQVTFSARGGARWTAMGMPWRATWPFAWLEVLTEGVRIRGMLVPTWDLAWSDFQSVKLTRSGALRISLTNAAAPIWFYAVGVDMSPMFIQLRHHGVRFE